MPYKFFITIDQIIKYFARQYYINYHKIIDQYNFNLIQTGLKLSVLGRKDSQPEGSSVWFTSIKDYPVVADIKDLTLGSVPITY